MNNTNENGFVAWEYVDINVNRNHVPLYTDCYQNFGWTLIERNEMGSSPYTVVPQYVTSHIVSTATGQQDFEMVNLKFKRDSRLPHKIQLDKLQRECEGALCSIQRLENIKSAYKIGPLIGFGMVGAAALGLSIYNFTLAGISLCILFAAISLVGWAAAFYSFAKMLPKKNAQVNPQIQEQFEIVYQTCGQANTLLA